MSNVYRIAVTGGPCAGKSTVMATLRDELEAHGYAMGIVPEAATILLSAGAKLAAKREYRTAELQANLIELQEQMEYCILESLELEEKPAVMLCDRGMLDNKAYMSSFMWDRVLDMSEMNEGEMLARYDGVLHLVSASVGAEEHYKTNEVRKESLYEARALENRTYHAWNGHHNRVVVGNYDSSTGLDSTFERKVERAVTLVKWLLLKGGL